MILISSCSCLCPIRWSQMWNWERRCCWSSAYRRCSNYIWVINIFIAYWGVTYSKELTVYCIPWSTNKNNVHFTLLNGPSFVELYGITSFLCYFYHDMTIISIVYICAHCLSSWWYFMKWHLVDNDPLPGTCFHYAIVDTCWHWDFGLGIRITKGLWAHDAIFVKLYIVFTPKTMIPLGHNFALVTAAAILWHPYICELIGSLGLRLEQKQVCACRQFMKRVHGFRLMHQKW